MIFVDLETTGLTPEDQVVEFAFVTRDPNKDLRVTTDFCSYDGLMPPEARAVHHINPEWCAGKKRWTEVLEDFYWVPENVLVAHNAAFDSRWFPSGLRWICTRKLAQHVWDDLPSYSLQALRYRQHLVVPDVGVGVHRAEFDAIVCMCLMEQKLGPALGWDEEEMMRISFHPSLIRRVGFGKHRGTLWSEVPRDYLQWVVSKGDQFDRDVVHTAKHWLEARA